MVMDASFVYADSCLIDLMQLKVEVTQTSLGQSADRSWAH